ncbi:MAG: RhuM family protein [bacterium]
MGLTSWTGSKVRQQDVAIAKNYLNADELNELNRIVVMYLDFAEDQARKRRVLYMKDWREKLDAFLRFNEREILDHSGKVSMEVAQNLALDEYEKFQQRRLKAEAKEDDREFELLSKKIERKALKAKT